MSKTTATIQEAQSDLSGLLAQVECGSEITLTDSSARPLARLTPISAPTEPVSHVIKPFHSLEPLPEWFWCS